MDFSDVQSLRSHLKSNGCTRPGGCELKRPICPCLEDPFEVVVKALHTWVRTPSFCSSYGKRIVLVGDMNMDVGKGKVATAAETSVKNSDLWAVLKEYPEVLLCAAGGEAGTTLSGERELDWGLVFQPAPQAQAVAGAWFEHAEQKAMKWFPDPATTGLDAGVARIRRIGMISRSGSDHRPLRIEF